MCVFFFWRWTYESLIRYLLTSVIPWLITLNDIVLKLEKLSPIRCLSADLKLQFCDLVTAWTVLRNRERLVFHQGHQGTQYLYWRDVGGREIEDFVHIPSKHSIKVWHTNHYLMNNGYMGWRTVMFVEKLKCLFLPYIINWCVCDIYGFIKFESRNASEGWILGDVIFFHGTSLYTFF